jgi:hypothetical protein
MLSNGFDRFDGIDNRLDGIENRLGRIESDMKLVTGFIVDVFFAVLNCFFLNSS